MASVVQICNMALSHLGSEAQVSSISPPDGSVEAGHCDTFYGQSRTEMLETGSWRFALKRATLAEVTNDSEMWAYAYALPSDCLKPLRILTPGDTVTVFTEDESTYSPNDRSSDEFDVEGAVLFTNMPEAVMVYVRDVTDTTKFTPSFTSALSYLLASYLAGPIVKEAKLGDAMRDRAMSMAMIAASASANASSGRQDFTPSSISARA